MKHLFCRLSKPSSLSLPLNILCSSLSLAWWSFTGLNPCFKCSSRTGDPKAHCWVMFSPPPTRIPGLFLENCILAHTCLMGLLCPQGWQWGLQSPTGWGQRCSACRASRAGLGWWWGQPKPRGHQAAPQPRCCLCMSWEAPSAGQCPWHKTRSWKQLLMARVGPGCTPSTAHWRAPPVPRGWSWLHRHGTSSQPKSQTSGAGIYTQSPTKLHPLASSIIKTLNNTGSSLRPWGMPLVTL